MDDLLNALMTQTSPIVQLWMNWMAIIFLASLFFVRSRPQARRALMALIATAIGGYTLWAVTGNVHLLGIVHLLIWLPLAIYFWKTMLSKTARNHDGEANTAKYHTLKYKAFFYWGCLLFMTIVISLIFDARDIFLVMTGNK